MTETWYISDLHLGHEKILALEPFLRPFKTIEEHDNAILENWNKVVKPNDNVWVLGDVSVGGTKKEELIKRLHDCNGTKNLVLGNHDPDGELMVNTHVFNLIYGAYSDGSRGWILTHIPVHPDCLGTRFVANIHGHLHASTIKDPRYVNVSCEQTFCTPINRDEVKKRLLAQKQAYMENG
jgi:calcineurin-like phosphoesterase family protein